MLEISLAPNLHVTLLPQRALFWAEEATLFAADLHLGKADVFQRSGVPIPATVTTDDLRRLGALLEQTHPRRLVILGDFFHAAGSRSSGVFDALHSWRTTHRVVEVLLVSGNHDIHAGPPPEELEIIACGETLMLGPFHCVHAPQTNPAPYTLCGHLHPAALLVEPNGARGVRLPCFHVGRQQTILPAFSTFTGSKTVPRRPGERIFVTTGDEVFEAALR